MTLRVAIGVEFKADDEWLIKEFVGGECNGVMMGTAGLGVRQPMAAPLD